ncbi:hypothetical protein LDENG_00254100, partial [Lucifuga dentata]
CFLQLKLISKLRPFLSFSDLEKAILAFITSRLDYCNSLFSAISKGNIHRLQLIQNAAVQLLTRSRRSDHITPIHADEPDRCLRSSGRNLLIAPEPRLLPKMIWPLLFLPLRCGIPCQRISSWLSQCLF